MFILSDLNYDESFDITLIAAKEKGEAEVIQDTFGFYFNDGEIGDQITFVFKARQALANKKTGTGEDIQALEKVYFYPATDNVSATAIGTAGADYYYCGIAKETASGADATVLIMFDGTRYAETI